MAQKWKYNGVELDETTGLYEMDFRQYDAAIGRFTGIDPVTHHSMSTYAAFDNNPAVWSDPSGANAVYNWDYVNRETGERGRYEDENGNEISFQEALGSYGLNEDGSQQTEEGNENNENSDGSCCGSSGVGSYQWHKTPAEEHLLKKYPGAENVIEKAAAKAGLKASFVTGNLGGGEDGYGDALRHSYWMFLIAQELGPDIARMFGNAHENIKLGNGGNNFYEPRGIMDRHNNEWGIQLAVKAKQKGIVVGSIGNEYELLFDDAYRRGEIIVIERNDVPSEALRAKRERVYKEVLELNSRRVE